MDVEKAARKELRKLGAEQSELRLVRNDTLASVVAEHLLPRIVYGWTEDGTVDLHPCSRDELGARLLARFLEDRDDDLLEKEPFLSSVPQKDLESYARHHGLPVKELVLDEREQEALELLRKLEDEQPQTMPSLRKTFVWLKEELNKRGKN